MADENAILKTVKYPYFRNCSMDDNEFGTVTHVASMNFTVSGHILRLLFYIIGLQLQK